MRFTIKPVEAGATINISKGRWERTFALSYLRLIRVLITISLQRVSELPLRFAGKTSHSLQLLLGEQAPETLMLLWNRSRGRALYTVFSNERCSYLAFMWVIGYFIIGSI